MPCFVLSYLHWFTAGLREGDPSNRDSLTSGVLGLERMTVRWIISGLRFREHPDTNLTASWYKSFIHCKSHLGRRLRHVSSDPMTTVSLRLKFEFLLWNHKVSELSVASLQIYQTHLKVNMSHRRFHKMLLRTVQQRLFNVDLSCCRFHKIWLRTVQQRIFKVDLSRCRTFCAFTFRTL